MERTITKKQLQAITKVCSKDTTRPALMRLAIQNGKLWATDGYIAVAYNLNAAATDLIIDPNKLKMKLAVMKPLGTLTATDLKELKEDENGYRYPNMDVLTDMGNETSGGDLSVDPALLARASTAIVDPAEGQNWFKIATYEKSHRIILTNMNGDMAIIMGGN